MAHPTPQSYLQILTLLLFTNRLLAFGRNVRSQYPQHYDPYDGAQGSNPAGDIMRQQVNGQKFFEGVQAILSLTQQLLDRLNATCSQLDTFEELLAQQGGGESISPLFQTCWPFLSSTLNHPLAFTEETDEPYIWRHPFLDLKPPITPLPEYQSPMMRPRHRSPHSWFKQPVTRFRQPAIDPELIPAFWLLLKSALPRSVNRVGKVWQRPIPPQESPPPDSTRQLSVDLRPFLPGDDHRRSLEHLWSRWSKQLFNNDRDPPPNNPYMDQPPPEDILRADPNVPEPEQSRSNMDRISRAILDR